MNCAQGLPVALLLACGLATAGDWQASVDGQGLREATGTGSVTLGVVESPASLTLNCRPGVGGTVRWKLAIERSASLGFGFAAFEGPGAPAAALPLGAIEVSGGMLQPRFTSALAGRHESGDRFVFELTAPANAASDAALLADAIGSQSVWLDWRVADFGARDNVLHARFDLHGAAAPLRETMMGCGPAPRIGPAERAAWRGRNPLGIDLFAHRAVQWRLKGLLGREFDATVARLSRAEPIGVDGETLFILAPDAHDPRSGIALMLRGAETEIVLIRAGVLERRASQRKAIPAPAAVREFVEARRAAQ